MITSCGGLTQQECRVYMIRDALFIFVNTYISSESDHLWLKSASISILYALMKLTFSEYDLSIIGNTFMSFSRGANKSFFTNVRQQTIFKSMSDL